MAKWADYCISAVRYEETENSEHIEYLEVRKDLGDKLGKAVTWSKTKVACSIRDDKLTFVTTLKDTAGEWTKGEDVRVVCKRDGEYYLRTDANDTEADNLEELPEF